jgi:hypothetical protein
VPRRRRGRVITEHVVFEHVVIEHVDFEYFVDLERRDSPRRGDVQ